jgi:hypothetical protein
MQLSDRYVSLYEWAKHSSETLVLKCLHTIKGNNNNNTIITPFYSSYGVLFDQINKRCNNDNNNNTQTVIKHLILS